MIDALNATMARAIASWCVLSWARMSQPFINIGILTIRGDEFWAVLKTFPSDHGNKGRHREDNWVTPESQRRVHGGGRACNFLRIKKKEWWRRGESNPRP